MQILKVTGVVLIIVVVSFLVFTILTSQKNSPLMPDTNDIAPGTSTDIDQTVLESPTPEELDDWNNYLESAKEQYSQEEGS